MTLRLATILSLLAVTASAQLGHPSLVGHWRMERQREAIEFNGTSQYMSRPYSAALNPPQMTVAVWARVTGGAGTLRAVIASRRTSPNQGWWLYAATGNTYELTAFGVPDANISMGEATLNTWVHLCVTYDGATFRSYRNGKFIAQANSTLAINETMSTFVGALTDGGPRLYFPGTIDDTRIYSRALSAAEVLSLYRGSDISDTGLEAWYKFDGDALDSSGNENHGTEVGDPEYVAETPDSSGNGNHGTLVGSPTLVTGKVGRGYRINSSTDKVNFGSNIPVTDPSVFTFVSWIKLPGSGNNFENLYRPLVDSRGWMIQRAGVGSNTRFRVDTSGATVQFTDVSGFLTGEWVHLAMVVDTNQIRIFRDGALVSTWSPNFGDGVWNSDADLGVGVGGLSALGDYDEPRIYNRALTATEIRQLYYGLPLEIR